MTQQISWLDGELTENPMIPARNRGLLVGMGVFETLKVSGGHAEFLEEHLQRLGQAWVQMGFSTLDLDLVRAGVGAVLTANTQKQNVLRLRITVTESDISPCVLVTLGPMQPWPGAASCIVLPWKRNENSPLVGTKTTSYAENVMGLQWARDRGFSEGIYLNSQGQIAEGTTSNIFIVRQGTVLTPPWSSGLLPGIIRHVLLENSWATEEPLTSIDLDSADEIFLTSSTRGIQQVSKCGDRLMPQVGSTTLTLIKEFNSLPK